MSITLKDLEVHLQRIDRNWDLLNPDLQQFLVSVERRGAEDIVMGEPSLASPTFLKASLAPVPA
jgi:hypothetical protein